MQRGVSSFVFISPRAVLWLFVVIAQNTAKLGAQRRAGAGAADDRHADLGGEGREGGQRRADLQRERGRGRGRGRSRQ